MVIMRKEVKKIMLTKKTVLTPAMSLLLSGIVLFGAGSVIVNAQTDQSPDSGLVAELASKFNLDKSQVQAVFDSYHKEHRQEMEQARQQQIENRLNQAVSDGKITSEQKKEILTEIAKLKSEFDPTTMKDQTDEERQASMQKHKEEIDAWSQSTGIDASYLMMGGRHGGPRPDNQLSGSTATASPTPTQ